MENPTQTPEIDSAAPPPMVPVQSHTREHSTPEPHTRSNLSTFSAPDAFTRMFLLAWAVRYIPRGALAELLTKNTIPAIKEPMTKLVDKAGVNRLVAKMEKALTENKGLLSEAQAGKTLKATDAGRTLFDKIKTPLYWWRGNAEKEAQHIVSDATIHDGGKVKLSENSKNNLRDLIRDKLDDMGFSLALFAGSSLLSIRYSTRVRNDMTNLFRETVAYEKNIPQEQVTFNDIANSDNRLIHNTVSNYHGKLRERLGTDSLFLLTTPLKSLAVSDFLLGIKGLQMFRDTWKRTPTIFEDLITFVNNKINPINGLGQPISVGEVFDLYQHYAQAFTPDRAFKGVIEHSQGEGARWAGNQIIFQRITELMNKTYAYKHTSVVDPTTGHSVMQADFALPKFMYLLGHDLIDINEPRKSLVAIELANAYGIPAVKEMGTMLQEGKPVEAVIQRYHLTLPAPEHAKPAATPVNAPANAVTQTPGPQLDNDATPDTTISAESAHASKPMAASEMQAALS